MKAPLQRLNLARRMLANGVPLHIDRNDENVGLLIHQIGAEMESCAFDLKCEGSGYMVNMRITITQEAFAIADIFLKLPWTDNGLSLIADPLVSGARYESYWFPGNNTLAFEREAVINHFVNVQRRLPRGKTIEGLLLWVGSEPIPGAFVHGTRFPASVIVLDQYDNPYPSEVSFWANRSERGAREKRKGESRTKLFSKHDVVPVG